MSDAKIMRLEAENELLTSEIAKLKAEYKSQITELKAKAGRAAAGRHLAVAAMRAGVLPEALPDLMNRADAAGWTTDEADNPVLWDTKRNAPAFDPENNLDMMTPESWVKSMKKTAQHFFASPAQPQAYGSGPARSPGGFDLSGRNPWNADTWDDMAQVSIYRENPDRAKAMAEAAGSHIGALRPTRR
jgi:hypothetical protein